MKSYLLTTGTIFGLLAAMHLGTLVVRWRQLSNLEFALENAALGGLALILAIWAFRLARRPTTTG